MAMQPAVCTNCGGKLNVDDTDLNGFCYCSCCDTPYKVIDVITVDGLPTVKSLLTDAEFCMNDTNYEKAVKLFNEVLTIKPNCHEAWWGLYTCNSYFDRYYGYQDKYGNSGASTKAAIMLNTINKYAKRAIQFAPPEESKRYSSAIKNEMDFIEQVRSGAYEMTDKKGNSGCYIATAVYGSYSCDEVLVLRRYRDDYLAPNPFGRLFIRIYYRLSPGMAKHIKPDSCTGRCIRSFLDKKVEKMALK